MTLKNALLSAATKLADAKITSARLDAEILLGFVLKKPREFLFAHGEEILTARRLSKYKKLIERRAAYFPVAYLTGKKDFFGLDFRINKKVLVPRPETEILVEKILEKIADKKNAVIADIGTGSGCIAISIAKNSSARVFAVDVSSAALRIARENARLNKISKRIKFFRGDLLKPLKNKKLDIIAANLPYLPAGLKKLLARPESKSLKHEPRQALIGGKDGLRFYRKLFAQIAGRNILPRAIFIEIDPRQTASLKSLIKKNLPQSRVKINKDLNGKNRVAAITF